MASQEEGFRRYLTACRHDIAHLSGESPEALAAWVTAHFAEGLSLYETALASASAEGDDGRAAEAAFLAVKQWAQGAHFRG